MSIEVKNITKKYGETLALDNVSLSLNKTEIYGLLGNNGAGKTTLLSIISDRIKANEGQVIIDNENASGNDNALGKVFFMSEHNLFPDGMKVKKAFSIMEMFYPNFDNNYALSLSNKFGLNIKKKITTLSTGYSSIFRLIIGLSCGAEYVIYDEPVLGLDAQHRDMFYKELIERYAEKPSLILVSTHLISEISDIIGHTVVIKNGKIIQDAPTDELRANAYSVSGPANAVEQYIRDKDVMSVNGLGGLKTACIKGKAENVPSGLEISRISLQDYFINLMNQEDVK